MSNSDSKISIPSVNLKQVLTDIIETSATEDSALGSILSVENELLEKFKTKSEDIQDYISFNESVNRLIKTITKLKIVIQFNVEDAAIMLNKIQDLSDFDDLEE